MLLELIIFAVVLVALQLVAGLIIFKLMTSKKFLIAYSKKFIEICNEIAEEISELD